MKSVFVVSLASLMLAGCFLDPEVKTLRSGSESASVSAPSGSNDAGTTISFARDIRPLFAAGDTAPGGCRPCHYAGEAGAIGVEATQFDMTTLGALRKGGLSSRAQIVVPGRPDQSVLVQKLEGTTGGGRMPLGRTAWTPADIAKVRTWILEGALGSDSE
jgi:hypothetical protein